MAGHDHSHEHDHRAASRRSLAIALALTATFTVAEVVGGLLTGSLALLADAGHMLSDSLSIALALGASWLASRPATWNRSFGYQRAEVLAALFNGLTLVLISVWIIYEGVQRFEDPPEVLGGGLLAVAIGGLLVNLLAAWVLSRGAGDNLNVAGALRHVLADIAGSVGAILAGLIIIFTGWRYADPVVSMLIAVLIARSAWSIIRDAVRILLEAAPKGLDAGEIGNAMASMQGVREVHDLHVWTITSGFPALSAHVLVDPGIDCHARRRQVATMLRERYGISHTTLQVEHEGDGGGLLSLDPEGG